MKVIFKDISLTKKENKIEIEPYKKILSDFFHQRKIYDIDRKNLYSFVCVINFCFSLGKCCKFDEFFFHHSIQHRDAIPLLPH